MNIFVENQPIKSPLVWIIIGPLLTIVCLALARAEHFSFEGMLVISIISVLSIIISVTLTSLTLSVVVTDMHVHVYLFPFTFIGTTIEHSNIDSVQIQDLSSYGHFGEKRPLERTFQMFALDGDHLLRIRTKEGRDVLIGTLDPVSLSKAVNSICIRKKGRIDAGRINSKSLHA